jgi:Trehalose synthase, N-terminal domain
MPLSASGQSQLSAPAVCGADPGRRPGPAGPGRAHHLERQLDRCRWWGRRDAEVPGRVRAGSGHPGRLAVITGDSGFFAITKWLHNQIHGSLSGAAPGTAEAGHYARTLTANAVELTARVRPGDVVLLPDPQTAGLAAPLAQVALRPWQRHLGPTSRTISAIDAARTRPSPILGRPVS